MRLVFQPISPNLNVRFSHPDTVQTVEHLANLPVWLLANQEETKMKPILDDDIVISGISGRYPKSASLQVSNSQV